MPLRKKRIFLKLFFSTAIKLEGGVKALMALLISKDFFKGFPYCGEMTIILDILYDIFFLIHDAFVQGQF